MIRFLEIQGPNCRETLHRQLPKATRVCSKKKGRKKPEGEGAPAPEKPSLCHLHYVTENKGSVRTARVPLTALLSLGLLSPVLRRSIALYSQKAIVCSLNQMIRHSSYDRIALFSWLKVGPWQIQSRAV